MTAENGQITLQLAHSPDPDDAFMWWPLFELDGRPPRLDTGRYRFVPVCVDIETLNHQAETALFEITAISCAQYPFVKDRYVLTACGSSMGEGYGPKLVSKRPLSTDDFRRHRVTVAVPGTRTSAFMAANLMLGVGSFEHATVPFDQIIHRVADGDFDAGLVIHEGQLTYQQAGLHLVADLGEWWSRTHNLPLPLGVNAIRRDLDDIHGEGTLAEVAALLLRSVEYAMEHRDEGVAYALGFARDMGADLADEFIGLYVNRLTLDFGDRGAAAVRTFLAAAHEAGLSPDPGEVCAVKSDAQAVRSRHG